MHVLITRPEPDGATLKSRVEALGYTATLAPLISIELEKIPAPTLEDATALIATSRNALRAIGESPVLEIAKSLPLYVVGPGSARLASELGFANIVEGQGTAADLVAPLQEKWKSAGGRFVYLAGDVTAFDLPAALNQIGVNVVSVPAYRSVAAETLPPGVIATLEVKEIDTVCLMSPRTSEIWAGLAVKEIAPSGLSHLTHACLSAAVASALREELPDARIAIADRPNVEDLLGLIKRLATGKKAG